MFLHAIIWATIAGILAELSFLLNQPGPGCIMLGLMGINLAVALVYKGNSNEDI